MSDMPQHQHLYNQDSLVFYHGQRVTILELLRTLKGKPVYRIAGAIYPVREEELYEKAVAKEA